MDSFLLCYFIIYCDLTLVLLESISGSLSYGSEFILLLMPYLQHFQNTLFDVA